VHPRSVPACAKPTPWQYPSFRRGT
jgi:hypothetical protein